MYIFESLDDVRIKTAEWVEIYNNHRPHASLGGAPPSEFLAKHLTGNVYS